MKQKLTAKNWADLTMDEVGDFPKCLFIIVQGLGVNFKAFWVKR